MERIEYRWIDKSAWGPGEWHQEPDKVQWMDTNTGLPCLIVRNMSGAWCGYVGISNDHPQYAAPYSDVDVRVHGGLTFAGTCQHDVENHGVCHIPGAGEPDNVFWLGFDCSHAGDLCPAHNSTFRRAMFETYRNMAYVQTQVAKLATQLAQLAGIDHENAH